MIPLVLVGPTAIGKSAVAMAIARARRTDVGSADVEMADVELISVDSMQVYRGMDIGTAKPSPAERAAVVHHLIDLVDPHEEFSAVAHQAAVFAALDDIAARGHRAILVGGTGLYVRAVVDGLTFPGRWPEVWDDLDAETDTAELHRRLTVLDPAAAGRMETTNRRRILRALEVCVGSGRPFSSFGPGLGAYPAVPFHLVGLRAPRARLGVRIADRFNRMLDAGLLDEVRSLAAAPEPLSRTAGQALGYRELLAHVVDGAPLEACVDEAVRRTRQFARRQEAWFRRDPRIHWIDVDLDAPGNPLAVGQRVLGDWGDRCRRPSPTK